MEVMDGFCEVTGRAFGGWAMERQLVSSDEIVRMVNERTRQPLYGGACTLGGVFRLPKPNRDGCNWLEARLDGIYTEGFLNALREIKARYNLQDET
jgi:hypothetical protein